MLLFVREDTTQSKGRGGRSRLGIQAGQTGDPRLGTLRPSVTKTAAQASASQPGGTPD
jgi:hypothetical protein